jgi:restriction system protein
VASLLKAMGYHIAFNAKRGKDGGIDIIAYSDPLGTKEPRMKVQIKHRPNDAVSVDVVKQLVANLNKSGDVGLFVTSGRFTSESERYSRESHKHIELIDFERFISLWQEFYPKMTDEEKNMLPLQPIYFLGVNE